MASLIDISYFFNELKIAQKSQGEVSSLLNSYIGTYEPEYLGKILGNDFYELFKTGISNSEQRFVTLKDMLLVKPSPIAAYVFFYYQRDNAIISTGAGDATTKTENAIRVPERSRQVRAWNIMAKGSSKMIRYLIDNKEAYPEFDIEKSCRDIRCKLNVFGI